MVTQFPPLTFQILDPFRVIQLLLLCTASPATRERASQSARHKIAVTYRGHSYHLQQGTKRMIHAVAKPKKHGKICWIWGTHICIYIIQYISYIRYIANQQIHLHIFTKQKTFICVLMLYYALYIYTLAHSASLYVFLFRFQQFLKD